MQCRGQCRNYSSSMVRCLNRILFDEMECQVSAGNLQCFLPETDMRYVHIKEVLKLQLGDSLKVGVIGLGVSDSGGVAEISAGGATIDIGHLKPVPIPRVSLILTVPRPRRLKRIIPVLANLGIHKLILTGAKDVPNDYFGSQLLCNDGLFREGLIEGVSLAATDCHIPAVHIRRNLWSFITKELDDLFPKDEYFRLLAHPNKPDVTSPFLSKQPKRLMSLSQSPEPSNSAKKDIVVAIGGEGGWHDGELRLLEHHDFQPVHFGSRIFRSDTAVSVAVGLCHELIETWDES